MLRVVTPVWTLHIPICDPTQSVGTSGILTVCKQQTLTSIDCSMLYGIVQKMNRERGFGFIFQEGRPDVYFHATVVENNAFDQMLPDQPVMFELAKRDPEAKDDRGPNATKVKLIDRIPGGILPPPTQALAPRHHPKARQRKPSWRNKPASASEPKADENMPADSSEKETP